MTDQSDASFGPREAQPVANMMEQAQAEGWDFFNAKLGADVNRTRASTESAEGDIAQLAHDARLLFETEQGRRVLEWLADISVRRPIWFMGAPDALQYVAMREGQNGLFFTLLKLIAAGREEKPPQREGQ